jgi:Phosphotransferase enzyme family.
MLLTTSWIVRKKYIARCLFRKIAQDIQIDQRGPFHLYCDDLRPSNVLVSGPNLTTTGVIDWEFTYVAPAEFTYTAPWWLLFESPETWESDLNAFLHRYTPRLEIFLTILRSCENEQIQKGIMNKFSTTIESNGAVYGERALLVLSCCKEEFYV